MGKKIKLLIYIVFCGNLILRSPLSAKNMADAQFALSEPTIAYTWFLWIGIPLVICGIFYRLLLYLLEKERDKHKQEIEKLRQTQRKDTKQIEKEDRTITTETVPYIEKEKEENKSYSKPVATEKRKETLRDADQLLIENTVDHIRSNIENPSLSVETMSRELGLSRTHLYRKLKKLTGKSPVDLIISIRMEQATSLLNDRNLSVSEVGYKVGYNTPSYFSSSFNTYHGMTPTDFREKEANKKETTT